MPSSQICFVLLFSVLSICWNFVQCGSIKKWYPAAGLQDIGCLSPECEHFLKLPYRPVASVKNKFKKFGSHGFIYISGHRMDADIFAMVGLGLRSLHGSWKNRKESCIWVSLDGPKGIPGTLEYVFPGEHHDLMYEHVSMICKLQEKTSDSAGGALFISVQGEDVMAVKEAEGKRQISPVGPYKHRLSFCSPPITPRIHPRRVLEALTYMEGIGVDHFVLYDAGGIDSTMRELLKPFFDRNMVEIVNIRQQHLFSVWHPVVTSNECVYRTRFTSEWVLMHEFDDFLHVPESQSLSGLLDAHKGVPWITFGTKIWSIEFCRPPSVSPSGQSKWPIERMEFHWPKVYCQEGSKYSPELCLSYFGLRRYIVDPRQVKAVEIHRIVDPEHGGVNLNTSTFIINRFSGISLPNSLICNQIVVSGKEPEWWEVDTRFAASVEAIRARGNNA